MKEQKKAIFKASILLVSAAALAFSQVNMQGPEGPPANPSYRAYSGAQLTPVGPGTINYVEGQASMNGEPLSPRAVGMASLSLNQALETGNGFVEVLLTPGSFLRVGNNSEVRLLAAGLADSKVQLARGSAMLEVDQLIKGTGLSVVMNGTTTEIEKKGLYDFSATHEAVRVLDGKAKVMADGHTQTLDKGDAVLLASNHPLRRRGFDEKAVKASSLYVWSVARSEDESQASMSAASNADDYVAAGPGWFWDPYWDFYGFWPYDAFLYSPFGWGFYSPAFFGYYGGGPGWYGGHRWYGGHGWAGHNWAGAAALHGRVGHMNTQIGGFRGAGFGGFHGAGFGGGFHGGGGHR